MDESGQPKIVMHGKANRNNKGEEIDISTIISKSGCADIYYKLEDCLGENDRDWRKCQNFVREWKLCSDEQKKAKQ